MKYVFITLFFIAKIRVYQTYMQKTHTHTHNQNDWKKYQLFVNMAINFPPVLDQDYGTGIEIMIPNILA